LSLDPSDSNALRVGRYPYWSKDRLFFELRLDSPDLRRQVLMLLDNLDPVLPDPDWLNAAEGSPE
jgi:hypothetical protein